MTGVDKFIRTAGGAIRSGQGDAGFTAPSPIRRIFPGWRKSNAADGISKSNALGGMRETADRSEPDRAFEGCCATSGPKSFPDDLE